MLTLKIKSLLVIGSVVVGACGGPKASVKKEPSTAPNIAANTDKDGDTDNVVDESAAHHHEGDGPHELPKDPLPPPVATAAALTLQAEVAAYDKAKPIFIANCSRCHTQGAVKASAKSLSHFDMSTYPLQGHHASTIGETIAAVLGQNSKPATMPKDKRGTVQGADLALIMTWTTAWQNAEKAGAHGTSSGDHLE
mgnify:CR=1 FL=1